MSHHGTFFDGTFCEDNLKYLLESVILFQFAEGSLQTLGLLAVTGVTACMLNIFNFLVTYYTGPVALQILGNVKTVFAIGASSLVFGNAVTVEQWCGAAICIAGCVLYQQKGHAIGLKR
jgi:drug/metabolite transporter (DMT)-like permease